MTDTVISSASKEVIIGKNGSGPAGSRSFIA